MNLDNDKIARNRITEEIYRNFFVEAGAGSGKTTSLVNRMVAMVEAGIDVGKICAITFTRAAAAEFYDRFQRELMKRDTPRCRAALENIDLCFMGTIDSFCNMIINEHPSEAGVPASASVKEDEQIKAAYAAEYTEMLSGAYGSELKSKAENFEGWHYNAADKFTDFMNTYMGTRNNEMVCPGNDDRILKKVEDAEKKIKDVIRELIRHPEWVHETKDSIAAWNVLTRRAGFLMGNWRGRYLDVMSSLKEISGLRLIKEADLRQLGRYGEDSFELTGARVKTYNINLDGPFGIVKELKEIQYSVTIDFIKSAMGPVADRLRQSGMLGYFDYLLYLRDMLKEDAAGDGRLIEHISRRHSFYLIDEFQDTNPMQAEVFFYLAAEAPVPEWKECVPRPGSLFIVGDPKQSIYGFRGADVGAFMKVRALFDGEKGDVLSLTRNFRSTDCMCQWFNSVFTNIMSEETNEQGKFHEIPANTGEKHDSGLTGVFKYDASNGDPEAIASMVLSMVDDPEYQFDGKPVRYGDFMVITRVKAQIGAIIKSFMDRGIPYRVAGDVLFAECPALVGAVAAFKCAAVPSSREYSYEASDKGFDTERLRNRNSGKSPVTLFCELIDTEDIFGKFGTDNIEYLYFATELLRESGADSMSEAAAYMTDMLQKNLNVERCINLDENENRVYIANLHKVKGLESNIVILADGKPPKFSADMRVDGGKCWVFSHGFYKDIVTDRYDEERELQEESLMEEYKRLMYVAATRAAKVLLIAEGKRENYWHLLSKKVEDKWVTGPSDDSGEDGSSAGKDGARADGNEAVRIISASEKSSKATYEIMLPSHSKHDYRIAEGEGEYDFEKNMESIDASLAGTMVHRLMEILISSGGWQGRDDQLVNMVTDEYNEDYSAMLASVLSTVRAGGHVQESGERVDILNAALEADECHCELPFCYKDDDGTIWNGIMDLVYRKGERWYIVDYKTNADASNLMERYKEQLGAYARAFRHMTGCEAETGIYHIDIT